MAFLTSAVQLKLGLLLVAAALAISPSGLVANAQTAPPPAPVVGCYGSVLPADTDGETDDEDAANSDDEDGPAIVGSIKAPSGMKEDDKRLVALATISSAQAQEAALAAIADADQRHVRSIGVESEQGYVIYAVKTERNGPGQDPKLEVKVDAGNGTVLLIECDPDDD